MLQKTKRQGKRAPNARSPQSAGRPLLKAGSPDTKLSAADKKQLVNFVKKAKRDGKIPRTAQQTIPYREMFRDGICQVNDRLFTKTLTFDDINYQLAQNDDKTQIFEGYCDFLNYFDSSVSVQLSFINQRGNLADFQKSIDIPLQGDAFDDIRREYADMLKNQLAKGNNGLVKKKYITLGIETDSLKAARPRLERIEADVINNFKTLGVSARPLSGFERLEVLHGAFHPGGREKLHFAWDMIAQTGLTSKDFIAPTSFDFRDGRTFHMGTTWGAASFIQILAPELTDRMLADLLDM